MVKKSDDDGELIRGDRVINETEAIIVQRIFRAFATGQSPRQLAKTLNAEGVPGPKGRIWTDTTIRGHERAKPILNVMGQKLLYAGSQGSGIGVKICNNMSLGISMIAAAETLMMAKRLGLDLERTHEIISNASGQNWPLNNYCPLPGMVEGVPSNNGYKPGFSAEMMRKDLRLSQDAALSVNATTPLAAHALAIFSHFCDSGDSQTDYSGISKLIGGDAWDYPFDPCKE